MMGLNDLLQLIGEDDSYCCLYQKDVLKYQGFDAKAMETQRPVLEPVIINSIFWNKRYSSTWRYISNY